jgi:hypothetical protein
METVLIISVSIIVLLWLASQILYRLSIHTDDKNFRYHNWSFYCSVACYILAFLFVVVTGACWLAIRFEGTAENL